jgi:small subunit ribosomal protein S15
MLLRSVALLAKDKEASMAARHAGKRAPPPRENTIDYQPLAYRFLGNYWKIKQKRPKSAYLIKAESEFLRLRAERPSGAVIAGLDPKQVAQLDRKVAAVLSLRTASSAEVSKNRKQQMISKFGSHILDSNSLPVQIGISTEKILNLRAHLIRMNKDTHAKRRIAIYLGRRTRLMKKLYSTDFPMYEYVCKELKIRCVRFAVPIKDPRYAYNPLAVDGDRARFLIRQRLWRGKHRPRHEEVPGKRGRVLYTKHEMKEPPKYHGQPKKVKQQVSGLWPYGLSADRVNGKHVVVNPTAPGKGHQPVGVAF